MVMNYIYILLDPTSNHVTSRGLGVLHLKKAMKKLPRNLVLLSSPKDMGSFDDYTRFELIRGEKSVSDFLIEQESVAHPHVKWIDYDSQELLHQLDPGEIAEMLYLSHANRHWHSPFFYKLQNNYVCLPMENYLVKVYYRYINEFFYQLALRIKGCVEDSGVGKRPLFFLSSSLSTKEIPLPSLEIIEELRPLLYEGAIFDFSKVDWARQSDLVIPIYLAEDQVDETINRLSEAKLLAKLTYDSAKGWSIKELSNEIFGG
ncbi:hypothetical protein HMPREF9243_0460 [Aerococcus sp. Group 1]|nr:hypothetical protein HMPREF9243_0460 [Aerococcus sp. Group 1]